jgi:DNA polymerase II small subunit/DNA polymerase delta subunit B
MEQMVNFSHYCPSSPFSLKTEPYIEDFLAIEELPHIMIAGKAQKFEAKTLKFESKSVLLVAIPAGKMGLISLNGTEAE